MSGPLNPTNGADDLACLLNLKLGTCGEEGQKRPSITTNKTNDLADSWTAMAVILYK
jgi:hypothetical protein